MNGESPGFEADPDGRPAAELDIDIGAIEPSRPARADEIGSAREPIGFFHIVAERLPTCCSDSSPPRYGPIHCGDDLARIYGRVFSRGDAAGGSESKDERRQVSG